MRGYLSCRFGYALVFLPLALIHASGVAVAREGDGAIDLGTITVEADRLGPSPESLTRNVTIIDRKRIEELLPTVSTVPGLLARTVPGMALESGAFTSLGQTMRGRSALVVIDGVPQKLNRNTPRDIFNIDVAAIQKIEVIHGGSALYGGGATGGIIYITTLQGGGEKRFKTRVEVGNSLTNFSAQGVSGRLSQTAQGSFGNTDYALAFSGDMRRGSFDAKGIRVAPEPSQGDLFDTLTGSLFGRLRHNFGDQSIGASLIFRDISQDSDYAADGSVIASRPGAVPARAIHGLELEDQSALRNIQGTIDYKHKAFLGGTLNAQFYARHLENRFYPFDARRIRNIDAILQASYKSDVYGGSIVLNTPLPLFDNMPIRLSWGGDFSLESHVGPMNFYDKKVFDSSRERVFRKTGTNNWVPPFAVNQYALFAQLEVIPIENLTLRGGVRQQFANASIAPYTTIKNVPVNGGSLDFSAQLFNIGANYALMDGVSVFADYSQSFDISDIGLQLRDARPGLKISESSFRPLEYNNYELGVRANVGKFIGSAALFYSKSELGALRTGKNFVLIQERNPEAIYGVELDAAYAFNDQWRVGGTLTYMEGHRNAGNGRQIALNGYRIPPVKATGFIEYSPRDWWTVRVDALYSGARDAAFKDGVGYGGRKVEDFFVVDASMAFQLDPGRLSLGVANLFNANYYNVYSQLLRNRNNTSHVRAAGTTFKVAYEVEW